MNLRFRFVLPFVSCLMSTGLLAGRNLAAAVAEPWVVTDQTIDCSNYDTILKGVIKDGMTNEQKALAMFYFFRQRVYHYQNMPESRDPMVCLNVLGNTLCGSQATCMKGLLEAAGIKVRIANYPGHTFYEASYDGKWHGFDTFDNFYIYTRGDNRNIASFDELKADPTLISDAVKEGRACHNMCPCGDDPMDFATVNKYNDNAVMRLDWSVKKNSLRKGEEFIRSWWPDGKPLAGTWNPKHGSGPLHSCGTHDRKAEPELFRFWEPYGIPKMGPSTSVSYRHYFNGLINYSPNLTNDNYKDDLLSESGVKGSADGLVGPGELVVPVTCSFNISAGQCFLQATCPGDGDSVSVCASQDGKQWTDITVAKDAGKNECAGDLNKVVVKPTVGLHAYQVKFVIKGKAVLNQFLLQTAFTHNAMAAPHLLPGKNIVTFTCGNAEALKTASLKLIYHYKNAPAKEAKVNDCHDWTGPTKAIEKDVNASPFTFEVQLPESDKLPQMLDLTFRSGTMAWTSDKVWQAPAPPAGAK